MYLRANELHHSLVLTVIIRTQPPAKVRAGERLWKGVFDAGSVLMLSIVIVRLEVQLPRSFDLIEAIF